MDHVIGEDLYNICKMPIIQIKGQSRSKACQKMMN